MMKNKLDIDEIWKTVHNFTNLGKLQNNLTQKTNELTEKLDETLTNISEYHVGNDWRFYLLIVSIGISLTLTIYVGFDIKRKITKKRKNTKEGKRTSFMNIKEGKNQLQHETERSKTNCKRESLTNENEIGDTELSSNRGNDHDREIGRSGNLTNDKSNYFFDL